MLKIFSLVILFLSFFANAGPTIRDNYVCSSNATFTGFDHTDDSSWYHITENQPFDGVSAVTSGWDSGCLNVKAGRKSSSSNKEWVENGMEELGIPWKSSNMASSFSYFAGRPSTLNFAIFGTLHFKIKSTEYSCSNVYLSEGSNLQGYNWWLSYNTDGKGLQCTNTTSGEIVYLYAVSSYMYPYNQSTVDFTFGFKNN